MKRNIALVAVATVAALAIHAAAPVTGSRIAPAPSIERAEAQKGAGNVKRIGENSQDLLSSILGPLAIVLVGAFAISALFRREFGQVLVLSAIGLVIGLYIFAPNIVERVWQNTYRAIFS